MPKITIDDRGIEAGKDATVLEAALENGVYIPNLCYHPDLVPSGACRLCIVEIDGMRGLPVSCATQVQEGMVVRTSTQRLQGLRRNVMWLLLSEIDAQRLPQDSQFKRLLDYIGVAHLLPGYKPEPKRIPVAENDPLFVRDLNLCILCGRCYRACKEIRGVGAIGLSNRGIKSRVTSAYGTAMVETECRFCGACVEVCPTGALRDKEPLKSGNREKDLVPCTFECPAGIDIPAYVALIAQARYADAIAVIRETVPFPQSLGAVCPHPCESVCRRGGVNEPICIRELKRFVAEIDTGEWMKNLKIAPDTGKTVAVAGAGPAGLTAAYFLRLKGHRVTVYEAWDKAGGMMRGGIPKYRLPEETLDREIKVIEDLGVVIKTKSPVDSVERLFQEGADAVFLALGACEGIKMGIPGEDDPRVLEGIKLLGRINFGEKVNLGKRIAVAGGGNVAFDIARVARRLGVDKVDLLYRRTRDEMPANPQEIEDAAEEGVEIQYLVNPVEVIPGKQGITVKCVRMALGEPDASGRRRPAPVEGSEFALDVDHLVVAIGQRSTVPPTLGVDIDRRGRIVATQDNLQCSRDGVFAGGDVASGPATVIQAIDAGRKAARAIDRFLGGNGDIKQELYRREELERYIGGIPDFGQLRRARTPVIPLEERFKDSFPEVERTFDEETAKAEAARCLRCRLRLGIRQAPLPPV